MASTEGLLNKFFEKWKKKRLNKAADKLIKDNPGLEKSLKKWDDAHDEVLRYIRNKK